MSAPQDYSGVRFEFAVGEIYGLRVWRQDELGRLRARHIEYAPAWRPGINRARCLAQLTGLGGFIAAANGVGAGIRPLGPASADQLAAIQENIEHQVPAETCRCGWYAYTRETVESFEVGGVVGVIRGSGRTLIGTRGFRCERAEIVALLDPTRDGRDGWRDLGRWQREKLLRLYPGVPLLESRTQLLDFAPIDWSEPSPADDDFWTAS